MSRFNWIKMGKKAIKVLLLVFLLFLLKANTSEKVLIVHENFNLSKTFGVTAMAEKKEEKEEKEEVEDIAEDIIEDETNLYSVLKVLSGDLTGYVADCPLCNGTLACMSNYNVYKNGVVTYNDDDFGIVRIVASSKNLACGSIIKFNLKSISDGPIYAIVLDRGVLGSDIDLLVSTTNEAIVNVGRKNITYEVLRIGW